MDKKKINLDELEGVSGGVIVDSGTLDRTGRYKIIDDNTGNTLFAVNNKDTAKRLARGTYNISDDIISQEDYEKTSGDGSLI